MKRKFILLAMMLLTLIGGVNLNVLNAQTQYRVKFPTLGDYYLTIFNNDSHPDGAVGGVGVDVYQESNAQKFTIETGANGGVYLKSADGYYIYCNGGINGWNVDAISNSDKSELYGFDMNGGLFRIYDDNGYIKVQDVNSAYYIFHNAYYAQGALWQLEEVLVDDGIIPAAPTNLVATAIDYKSISLTWTAGDENALEYNIYQGGVNIGSTTETSYTVEGLTAETNYCFTVEAVHGVNVSESHSNEACETTPEVVAPVGPQTIAIGSGTNESGYLPVHTYYYYGYTQQIYTADELNFPFEGEISKIRFKQSNTIALTRSVVIYMINTSKESFTAKNDWVAVTDADKVFEGSMQTGTSIVEVTLDKDFVYTGGNILLAIQDITGSDGSTVKFYTYNAENRAIKASGYYTAYGPSSIPSANYSSYTGFNNQIEFTIEIPAPSIEVNHASLDFGTVRAGGDFWTEKETRSFNVNVTAKNTTIKTITGNDDFFKFSDVSGAVDQTEFNFTVSYNKAAEAGEKSGKIVVTYMNGEEEATFEIPMTATAYVPAQGDVVENPKAITFTEGAYTDNVTGVYDDYILPGEENDGNNGDAVYTFTLTEESLISANVEGTNGLVAIYRAADLEDNGPSSENSFAGNENNVPEVSTTPTTFFYDFEDGSLEDFNVREYDANNNHWQIIKDASTNATNTLISYSYHNNPYVGTADNYIYTKELYRITANSKLTMDAKCNGYYNGWDEVMVKVSKNGEEFTLIETVKPEAQSWVNNITVDLGAIFASKNIEYGDYHIALHHKKNDIYSIQVDNLKLTDGSKSRSLAQTRSTSPQIENVYPAGEYVLVTAAEGDFTFNITTGDIPAPEATVYFSPENNATEVADATLVFQLGKYTDEYQVLVGTSADALETVVDWTSELATTYTLADATNNTKYYWQVNTRNAKDVETTGEVWSFVTPLDVPQNVTATATELYQDNNTTTISWTEIEGLTYNVYVDGVKQNEEAVTATEYVLSDLAWSLEGHSVTVTANHGELGESLMSEAVVVKVAGTFTITVNAVEGATVALSYSEGATDEFGNQLEDVYTNVTTDVNGQAVFENVKLLGDWSAHYYEINVTKGLYDEEVRVINNVTIAHDENYEVDVEMTLTTPNFNVSSETIHVGESVTLTWDAIEAENVTYNVYVNGTKHNAEAITAEEYVISDLAYNMNPGNAVAVTAVHGLGETPQDPIYVQVAGTFTLTVNVTDGTNPIEGATVNVTTDEYTYDEFGNNIASLGSLLTDENGQAVFNNVKLLNPDTYNYYCVYNISATMDVYGTHSTTPLANYESVANGDNVTREIVMTLPEPQNVTADKELYIAGEDVVLTWETPEFNTRAFLGYNVYSVIDGDYDLGTETSYTKLNEETLTETTYTIENVEYGAKFAVSAVYDEGESSKVNANVQITTYANLVVNVKDANTSAGIDGAVVEIYSYRTGETETFVTANGGIVEEEYLLGNYTVTVKKNDSHYEVEPQEAQLVYGDGAELEFALTPKASIENVTVTADNNGNVSWTGDYTKWNVYRRNTNAPQELTPVATKVTTTSTADDAWETLEPGTYQYGVSALVEPQAQTRGTEVIFEEGFENNGTTIPAGWSRWTSGYAGNWTPAIGLNYGSYSSYEGTYSAFSNGTNGSGYAYIQTINIELSGEASMNFYYIAPSWGGDINSLIIKVIPQDTYEEYEVFNTNKISYSVWTPGYVDLSGYQGKTIKIQFICENGYGYGVGIDNIVITEEVTSEVETQIVWSNDVVKQGPATFIGGDTENPTAWNVDANWSTGSVPADGAEVTINANAVITSEVNVASITINKGDSYPYNTLTVADKGILTVTGTISQQSDYLLVLEEGGQIFQNNANVTARFRMSIDNPEDWSDETNKDGWQFISMPFNDAVYSDFAGTYNPSTGQNTCDYDLYKYDGSQELEWLNYKENDWNEDEFISGYGYLASRKEVSTVIMYGTLNNATSKVWGQYFINNDKVLANFKLLGNPFTFDMDMAKLNSYGTMVTGYAVVNANGEYEYKTDGTVKVGDGFFVKLATDYAQLNYDHNAKSTRSASNNSLNITATGNAGEDNVIINLAGKSEGFDKLQNFNDAIATVYVAEGGKNYGIYNCDADVQEVELNFNANQMGNYTISIEPNGKFQTVTLVDRFTGIETNMLVEDYHFTAMSGVNNNRFIVKLAVSDQQSAVSDNFVYQSGEDLIIDAEGTVQIIDVMGRVLLSDEVESTNNRINVSGFQNGTYMVRVINGSEVKVEKVVIY